MSGVERLRALGLEHLGAGASASDHDALVAQLAAWSTADLARWRAFAMETAAPAAGTPTPVDCYPADPTDPRRPWDLDRYRAVGEALIAAGKVAAFVVAGGQGTRLGHPGPKGTYPATPITRTSLFGVFGGQLRVLGARYGVPIPWYVMTSPQNDAQTRAFFAQHAHFGLDPADVWFFEQGVLPTFGLDGGLLRSGPGRLATNPDGHGGSVLALERSGALADMRRRGIEHLSYFQVDNPATLVLDPVFLGLHAAAPDSSGEMSAKMVAKTRPDERVGVFARVDGATRVIEYSDLSPAQAAARRPDGGLVFDAGNVAVHAFSVDFLERVAGDVEQALPLHRARKAVPTYQPSGAVAVPGAPNAIKLERFVFDALSRARASVILEVDRVEAFAPIKNAEGADSPATSRALQIERAARWLEAAGGTVPRDAVGRPDCLLEIRPEAALEAGELVGRPGPTIRPGGRCLR